MWSDVCKCYQIPAAIGSIDYIDMDSGFIEKIRTNPVARLLSSPVAEEDITTPANQ